MVQEQLWCPYAQLVVELGSPVDGSWVVDTEAGSVSIYRRDPVGILEDVCSWVLYARHYNAIEAFARDHLLGCVLHQRYYD